MLVQRAYQQETLPPQFQQEFDHGLKLITQDLGNLSGFVDRVASEADQAKNKDNESQKFQATAGVQAVEIEGLRNDVEQLQRALSGAEKSNVEVQQTYQNVLLSMEAQKKQDQEKLKVSIHITCESVMERFTNLLHSCARISSRVNATCSTPLMMTSRERQRSSPSSATTTTARRPASSSASSTRALSWRRPKSLISSSPTFKLRRTTTARVRPKFALPPFFEALISQLSSVSYQPTMMTIQGGQATPAADLAWTGRRPSRVTPPAPNMRRTPSAFQSGSMMRPGSAHPNSGRYNPPGTRPSTGRPGSSRVGAGAARYRFEDTSPQGVNATEFGSPQPSRARQMVLAQSQEASQEAIEEWKENFSRIFRLVHGWASQYAVKVQEGQSVRIQEEAPRLWEFMCDILYPGQPEAGASHTQFLLEDQHCRPYFVERCILQYIVNNVLSVEGWMGFSDEMDQELRELNDRLQSTEGKCHPLLL